MIAYRETAPADGATLAAMARGAFTDTFGSLHRESDRTAFLDQADENRLMRPAL